MVEPQMSALKPVVHERLLAALHTYVGQDVTEDLQRLILDAARRVLRWALETQVTGMLVDGKEVGRDLDAAMLHSGSASPQVAFVVLTARGRRLIQHLMHSAERDTN